MRGGSVINDLIFPATAVLGLSIYRQFSTLKKYWLPVLIGTVCAWICSIGSTWFLCYVFGIDKQITVSLFPKSVTAAVALDLAKQIGGIAPIAMLGIVSAGMLGGTVISPTIMMLLKLKNPIALGVAIGTNHHAAGTARAMEISEQAGAISSVCIGTEAVFTTIAIILLSAFGFV